MVPHKKSTRTYTSSAIDIGTILKKDFPDEQFSWSLSEIFLAIDSSDSRRILGGLD